MNISKFELLIDRYEISETQLKDAVTTLTETNNAVFSYLYNSNGSLEIFIQVNQATIVSRLDGSQKLDGLGNLSGETSAV